MRDQNEIATFAIALKIQKKRQKQFFVKSCW